MDGPLVKQTFRLHFYWQLLSPWRYTKAIHLFGKPRSVVLMPKMLKGGVARMFILRQTSVKMAVLLHKQAKAPFILIIAVYQLSDIFTRLQVIIIEAQ